MQETRDQKSFPKIVNQPKPPDETSQAQTQSKILGLETQFPATGSEKSIPQLPSVSPQLVSSRSPPLPQDFPSDTKIDLDSAFQESKNVESEIPAIRRLSKKDPVSTLHVSLVDHFFPQNQLSPIPEKQVTPLRPNFRSTLINGFNESVMESPESLDARPRDSVEKVSSLPTNINIEVPAFVAKEPALSLRDLPPKREDTFQLNPREDFFLFPSEALAPPRIEKASKTSLGTSQPSHESDHLKDAPKIPSSKFFRPPDSKQFSTEDDRRPPNIFEQLSSGNKKEFSASLRRPLLSKPRRWLQLRIAWKFTVILLKGYKMVLETRKQKCLELYEESLDGIREELGSLLRKPVWSEIKRLFSLRRNLDITVETTIKDQVYAIGAFSVSSKGGVKEDGGCCVQQSIPAVLQAPALHSAAWAHQST
jgi:hypothetical protein